MRNRVLSTIVLTSMLMCPAVLAGQSPAPTSSTGKIGILNIQAAIANTAEGKKALSDLEKKYQPKRQELQKMQQDITGLEDQLQRQQATLSEAEQARLNRQIQEKRKILTRTQEDAQADLSADREDVLGRINQKMGRLIQDFAEQNGYSVIMDLVAPVFSTSGQIGDAQVPVYYAAAGVDVTQEIIKRYDAANPVAAAEAAPPAAPPASRTTATPKPAAKPPAKPQP